MHINPDHYLETRQGRYFSTQRNRSAWCLSFYFLDKALQLDYARKIYIMIGCQASGKSTWAKKQLQLEKNIIIFDAILVKRSERALILTQTQAFNLITVAVVMHSSLDQCLTRNRLRPSDERVNDNALRNVFQALEYPTFSEGFNAIITAYNP